MIALNILATRTPQQHMFDVARRQGDIIEMKELLNQGINPNSTDESGTSVLITAINYDGKGLANVNAVCLLLLNGVDPERRDKKGWTALHHACVSGSVDCVSELYNHGADLNALTNKGETSLDLINQLVGLSCGREHIKFLLAKYTGQSKDELKKIIEETPCRQHSHDWTIDIDAKIPIKHGYSPY